MPRSAETYRGTDVVEQAGECVRRRLLLAQAGRPLLGDRVRLVLDRELGEAHVVAATMRVAAQRVGDDGAVMVDELRVELEPFSGNPAQELQLGRRYHLLPPHLLGPAAHDGRDGPQRAIDAVRRHDATALAAERRRRRRRQSARRRKPQGMVPPSERDAGSSPATWAASSSRIARERRDACRRRENRENVARGASATAAPRAARFAARRRRRRRRKRGRLLEAERLASAATAIAASALHGFEERLARSRPMGGDWRAGVGRAAREEVTRVRDFGHADHRYGRITRPFR